MAYLNLIFVLVTLHFCVDAVTGSNDAPVSTHYRNITFPTTSTRTSTSISLDLPSVPTEFISDPGDDLPSQSDIGEDIPSSSPTTVLQNGPTPSLNGPVTATTPTSTGALIDLEPVDNGVPSIDPTLDPKPPSPSDDPGNFAAPGTISEPSGQPDEDVAGAPEGDANLEPGTVDIEPEGDGDDAGRWDPFKTNATDDTVGPGPGPSDSLVDDSTPAFFVDDTGTNVGISDDTPPAVLVDDEGIFISVPALDATDPLDGIPPTIISNPAPGQVSSIAHTLPGRVTSLATGLGVVLPGSTMVPLDPFLPSLTGSITVVNSQTFVVVPNPTTVALSITRSVHGNGLTASLPGRLTSISGILDVILPGSTTIPVNSYLPGLKGSTTVIGSSTFVILSEPTTLAVSLPKPVNHITTPLPGRTTLISGTLNVVLPGSTTVPMNNRLSGLTGRTTVIGSETFVVIANPTTIPVNVVTTSPEYPAGTPSDSGPTGPLGDDPKSVGLRIRVGVWELLVCLLGFVFVFVLGMW
ncbi:hypothetical protein BKA65DRAFT_484810 [Rhexocercosporidium sp. MPI-PUGE-AT-0058]|nr:hypothetical protein BKA65DRAFT_484810 [Rhexocercosporidium sp. MPI-PUGE-AT-0058]